MIPDPALHEFRLQDADGGLLATLGQQRRSLGRGCIGEDPLARLKREEDEEKKKAKKQSESEET